MKRRDFLTKTALGTAAGTALLVGCGNNSEASVGAPAIQTRPTVRWRLASSFPRSLDTIFGAAELLAERVSQLTDGKFTIRAYPGGELVPGLQVLDAVQQGTVQVGHSASYYYKGKNPALSFDACVPFGLTVRQQNAWLYHGGGLELMREVFADFNILNFPGGNTGVQMGGWFRQPLGSVTDLQGLKMRIPGLGGDVMDRLGVTVQVLSGGDIYPALERGAIDATEWIGPYDDEKLGFHKVAKNYYYPGWWEPGPGLSFYVNQAAWDSLPTAYQQVFEGAAREANLDMQAKYDAKNPAAMQRLLNEGVEMRAFPDDIMQAAAREAVTLMEEHASNDAGYAKIYTAWQQFRDEANRWFATAELATAQFLYGNPNAGV